MSRLTKLAVAAGPLVMMVGLAYAADQTILGLGFQVKDPKPGVDASKRKFKATAKEKNSPNTLVGNPTLAGSAGGAILELFAFGGTPSTQSFTLPQGTSIKGKPFWAASGTNGYKYKDSKGENGPVKAVKIKRSPSGQFNVSITVDGKLGALNVVPPNPGTSGCVALKLGIAPASGDRYSLQYGPESQLTNKGATFFKARKPQLEGVCPGGGPTTTSTTVTTTSSTTTTTLYGSPSRAFLSTVTDLLD